MCPRPLPDIFDTFNPKVDIKGSSTNEVLSPTPPVLCLSTLIPSILDRSTVYPDSIMAFVKLKVSSSDIPLKYIAIKRADT